MQPTPTQVQDRLSGSTVPSDSTVTKEMVVQAICDEASAKRVMCDLPLAERVYNMLDKAAKCIQPEPHTRRILHHLTHEELATLHDVLEVVMVGNDSSPESDTAHALINAHFVLGGTHALVHTMNEERGAEYCAVALVSIPA